MKLIQDNPYNGINDKKIEIEISEDVFIYELRKFFKWRKNISFKRYTKLGSSKHDEFIKYLYNIKEVY